MQTKLVALAFVFVLCASFGGCLQAVGARSNSKLKPIAIETRAIAGYNNTITLQQETTQQITGDLTQLSSSAGVSPMSSATGTANWYAAAYSYTWSSLGVSTQMWVIYPDILPSNSQFGLHVKVSTDSSTGYGSVTDNQAFIAVESSQGALASPTPAASGGSTTVGITFSYPPGCGVSYTAPSKTMNIFTQPGFGNTKVYWNGYHYYAFANGGPDTLISNIVKPWAGYQQNLNNYNGYVWENSFYWGWDYPADNDYTMEANFMYVSTSTHTPPLDNNLMPVFVTGAVTHYQSGNFGWASTAYWVMWGYSPTWILQEYTFRNTQWNPLTFYTKTGSFTTLGGLVIKLTNHADPSSRIYRVWVNDVKIEDRVISVASGSSVTFSYNIQSLISANAQVKLTILITTWDTGCYWTVTSYMLADPSHT